MFGNGRRFVALAFLLGAGPGVRALSQDVEISNWTAPPYWSPSPRTADEPEVQASSDRTAQGRTVLAAGPTALPFVALLPCRLVDTRGNAPLTGGFLPPATVRSYTLAGVCNVPANAQAISLNVTVVHPTGPGFITLYPQGGAFPPVSTLNYLGNDVIVNAAVVPLSATGGISMALGVSGGDVILDTNGYYAQTPTVTGLNTLTGDVTLSAGTNVTITPSGNTLTIASTGGSGGPPTGAAGGSLAGTYPNPGLAAGAVGSSQLAAGAVTDAKVASGISYSKLTGVPGFVLKSGDTMSGGLTLSAGNLVLGVEPSSGSGGSIVKGGKPFLHDTGAANTFLGVESGNGIVLGGPGGANTAVGHWALHDGSSGDGNTAIGGSALFANTTGNANSAAGLSALTSNTTGVNNTAMGAFALGSNTTGSRNTALGYGAGQLLTTGDYNIDIYHPGVAADYGVVRIGTPGYQIRTFVAGIRGVATGVSDGLPVFVDSNGQLGTGGGTISATNFSGPLAGDVSGTQSVTVVGKVGGQTAANVAAGSAAANAATNANTASAIVKRDASGNFSAGTITANLTGNAATATNFSGPLAGDVIGTQSATVVSKVGGQSAAIVAAGAVAANAATESNTAGSIMKRDAFGRASLGQLFATGIEANDYVRLGVSSYILWAGNLLLHTSGVAENVSVGVEAGNLSSAGIYNSAFGYVAGQGNTTGSSNTALGAGALYFNSTGSQNTAAGHNAGARTGLGTSYSGFPMTFVANTFGSWNTFLGYGTGATNDVLNCTAVGVDAYCDASHQVRLGNSFVTSIGGKVAWSVLSDARAKDDIVDLDRGLDLVLRLRPVAYKLKGGNGRTDMGFLAQDVEALFGESYNIVDAGGDPDRTLSLRYTDLIAPLVKAVQEQQARIEKDREEIRDLERRLARLEALLTAR